MTWIARQAEVARNATPPPIPEWRPPVSADSLKEPRALAFERAERVFGDEALPEEEAIKRIERLTGSVGQHGLQIVNGTHPLLGRLLTYGAIRWKEQGVLERVPPPRKVTVRSVYKPPSGPRDENAEKIALLRQELETLKAERTDR